MSVPFELSRALSSSLVKGAALRGVSACSADLVVGPDEHGALQTAAEADTIGPKVDSTPSKRAVVHLWGNSPFVG